MSNITTDLKQSTDIDHSFAFNNKVSNIADDYVFNNETAKTVLKRKRELENIVGTKKSKKGLYIKLECNQTAKYFKLKHVQK